MAHVLTLVARDSLPDDDLLSFAPAVAIQRLDHRAADIVGPRDRLDLIGQEARAHGLDAHVSPTATRRKRLLICDMDSTIIEQECIDELGRAAGCYDDIAAVTERAMRGELDFEAALTERVARLAHIPANVVDRLLAEVITLSPGAATLVATMKAHGAYTALVSGGFTVFTGPIAARVGFDLHRSNTLGMTADGTLDGTVHPPILGRDAKRETLIVLCRDRRLTPMDVVAIGDGANDLAMIEVAGLGIAYRAKPAVRAAAGAAIDHTDLTAALYFQGITPKPQ